MTGLLGCGLHKAPTAADAGFDVSNSRFNSSFSDLLQSISTLSDEKKETDIQLGFRHANGLEIFVKCSLHLRRVGARRGTTR